MSAQRRLSRMAPCACFVMRGGGGKGGGGVRSGVRSGVSQVGPLLNVCTLQVPSHLPHLPHTHTCAASGDLICVVSVICATSASLSNSINSLVNATKLSKLGTALAAAAPGFADARLTPPGAGGVESVEAQV